MASAGRANKSNGRIMESRRSRKNRKHVHKYPPILKNVRVLAKRHSLKELGFLYDIDPYLFGFWLRLKHGISYRRLRQKAIMNQIIVGIAQGKGIATIAADCNTSTCMVRWLMREKMNIKLTKGGDRRSGNWDAKHVRKIMRENPHIWRCN